MNYCNPVNIVWIERGIIIIIIEYLTNNYKYLKNRRIIVENSIYRKFFRFLFPKLYFYRYSETDNNPLNFYLNIRRILKKQDVIIDYLNNYDDYINTKMIDLVPWYDGDDILTIYIVDKKESLSVNQIKQNLLNFSHCNRGNYFGHVWDMVREKQILVNYVTRINPHLNWNQMLMLINAHFKKYFRYNMVNRILQIPIEVPKIIEKDSKTEFKVEEIESEEKLNKLLRFLTLYLRNLN
jgi:hypothetical protein